MFRVLGLLLLAAVSTVAAHALPPARVFIGNSGQWPSHVLYGARTADGFLWITTTGFVVDQRAKDALGTSSARHVEVDLLDASGSSRTTTTLSEHAPAVSVFRPGASGPQMNASTVVVHDVRRGIDLEYVWDGDHVRYNILADAGVNVPNPLFSVKGARSVTASDHGIELRTDLGTINMGGIVAYQRSAADVRTVRPTATASTIGFRVDGVSATSPLTIDPIVYLTSIHGSADEEITSIKRNANGTVVVGGWTTSADLDMQGASKHAARDGFVACYNADLGTLLAFAYIGGDSADAVRSIALASNGEVWVAGETNSPGLPFPASPIRGAHSGSVDGFVVRLTPNFSSILSGMYLAGNGVDRPLGIAVSKNNEAAVVGQTTSSSGMPSGSGYSAQPLGGLDAFMMELSSDGKTVNTYTYFGSAGDDAFTCVTYDVGGNIVAAGWTGSNEYKTWPEKTLVWVPGDDEKGTEGYYKEVGENPYDVEFNGGNTDAVITKFNGGGDLVFSTYFGGGGADAAYAVMTDADADVYAVGTTWSTDLPLPDGSPFAYSGMSDAFFTAISKDGLRLRSCGYYGGSGEDEGRDAVLDANKVMYLTGTTNSPDLQAFGAGSSAAALGGVDGFLAKMTKTALNFSSKIGWTGDDMPTCIAIDDAGDAFIGGGTTSVLSAVQRKTGADQVQAGSTDAMTLKFAFGLVTLRSPAAGTVLCGGKPASIGWLTEEMPSTEYYFVDVTGDNGQSWTTIASDLRTKSTTWTVPTAAPDSGTYQFRVRTLRGHVSLSAVLGVGLAPEITSQPASTWVCPGGQHELRVEAAGEGVTYQWFKDGSAISGATSASYAITSASAADAGAYYAMIGNDCASSTSATAEITVAPAPVITEQPASTSLEAGRTLTLRVTAQGPDLTYQWSHDGTPIAAPAGTQATLVIDNVSASDAGTYRCVIGSSCGQATSETATVSIVTSVDEEGNADGIMTIAPQPTSDLLTVTLARGATMQSLVIRDLQGQTVVDQTVGGLATTAVPTSHLAPGVYAIAVQSSSGFVHRLVVIQR